MKFSVIRLIYKKRGDIKDFKNWRILFLLNVNYKICLKVIVLRFFVVFDFIVDFD